MKIYDVPRFWVQMGACMVGVYQALSPGPGDEAKHTWYIHCTKTKIKYCHSLFTASYLTDTKRRVVATCVLVKIHFHQKKALWNKHDYDHTMQLSIPYHCDNANSSPVLIPVYLASANPMTQRNSTAIHALTNMQIATAMSQCMPLFPSYSC